MVIERLIVVVLCHVVFNVCVSILRKFFHYSPSKVRDGEDPQIIDAGIGYLAVQIYLLRMAMCSPIRRESLGQEGFHASK